MGMLYVMVNLGSPAFLSGRKKKRMQGWGRIWIALPPPNQAFSLSLPMCLFCSSTQTQAIQTSKFGRGKDVKAHDEKEQCHNKMNRNNTIAFLPFQ